MCTRSYIYAHVPRLFSKIYQIETLQTTLEETLTQAGAHRGPLYKVGDELTLQLRQGKAQPLVYRLMKCLHKNGITIWKKQNAKFFHITDGHGSLRCTVPCLHKFT